jgi:hypothetical protein
MSKTPQNIQKTPQNTQINAPDLSHTIYLNPF